MRPKAWNSPQVPSGALSNAAGIRDGVPDLQLCGRQQRSSCGSVVRRHVAMITCRPVSRGCQSLLSLSVMAPGSYRPGHQPGEPHDCRFLIPSLRSLGRLSRTRLWSYRRLASGSPAQSETRQWGQLRPSFREQHLSLPRSPPLLHQSECQGSSRATTCLLMCAHRVMPCPIHRSAPILPHGVSSTRRYQGFPKAGTHQRMPC